MLFFGKRQLAKSDAPLTANHIYLIDTENVRSVWTLLLDRITDDDKVYVFYTMNSGAVSYEQITGILQYGDRVELQECFTGKNGLDFQLVSYLGYLIQAKPQADYCIVTDDNGFDAVVKFWAKKGIQITRKTAAEVSGKSAKSGRKVVKSPNVKAQKNPGGYSSHKAELKRSDLQKKEKSAQTEQITKTVQQEARDFVQEQLQKQKLQLAEELKVQEQNAQVKKSQANRTQENKTQEQKPQEQKPQEKKPQEKKPQEQKPQEQKPQEKKPREKKPQEKKIQEKKTQEKKPQEQKSQEQKPREQKEYVVDETTLKIYISSESDDKQVAILEILSKAGGPKNLAQVHDGLEQLYRDEHAVEVYKTLRTHMKEIYKNK